jgi:hypothetical protein
MRWQILTYNGFYRFSPIKIGLYTLTVSAPNFETRKQENIRVIM